MLTRRQVTVPVCAVSLRLRNCGDDRLPRWRRTGNAHEVQRRIIDQTKICAAGADRQMLGQMAIGAQCPHAQFGDRGIIVAAAKLA